MTQIFSYFPGQVSTIFLEIKNSDGYRVDDGYVPVVSRVVLPSMQLATGYPQLMSKFDTGLYYFKYTIPSGAVAIGSYLIDVYFVNPTNGMLNEQTYQLVVTAPFGNYGVTIGN